MSKIIALLYKRQITLIQQTLYTTINFVKEDLEGKIINFTKRIVDDAKTIVTSNYGSLFVALAASLFSCTSIV